MAEDEGGHDTITSLAGEKMLSKYYRRGVGSSGRYDEEKYIIGIWAAIATFVGCFLCFSLLVDLLLLVLLEGSWKTSSPGATSIPL